MPTGPTAIRAQSQDDDAAFLPPVKNVLLPAMGGTGAAFPKGGLLPAQGSIGNGIAKDAPRTRVDHLMKQSHAALQQGQTAQARKFAIQAMQAAKEAKLTFKAGELTPVQLLSRIDASGSLTPQDIEYQEGSGIQLIAGVEEPVQGAWAEDEVAEEAAAKDSVVIDSPNTSPLELAKTLVSSAREDLKSGRLDEARRKALQADALEVTWALWEDQPMYILEDADRRSGGTTLVKSKTTEKPSAKPADEPTHDAAVALVKEAREALKAGDLELAREKALSAQRLNVGYRTFEDLPELVLQDINAQSASAAEQPFAESDPQAPVEGSALPNGQDREKVQKMLAQARKALEAGRIDEARELAVEADQYQIAFGVFDDSPESVLNDIARNVRRQSADAEGVSADPKSAASERSEGARLAAANLSAELMKQARSLLDAGKPEEAYLKADKARKLNVPDDGVSERPESLLAEIEQAIGGGDSIARKATADPAVTVAGSHAEPGKMTHARQEEITEIDVAEIDVVELDEVNPVGVSAMEHYNRGLSELNQGRREAAYAAFLAAHQTGQKLDRVRAQRMQDFLRELAPSGKHGVRTASLEEAGDEAEPLLDTASDLIGSADRDMQETQHRLREQVVNNVFKAERLRDNKDPEKGLQLIDQTIALVEGSNLTGEPRNALLRSLQRTRTGLEHTITEQEPNLARSGKTSARAGQGQVDHRHADPHRTGIRQDGGGIQRPLQPAAFRPGRSRRQEGPGAEPPRSGGGEHVLEGQVRPPQRQQRKTQER